MGLCGLLDHTKVTSHNRTARFTLELHLPGDPRVTLPPQHRHHGRGHRRKHRGEAGLCPHQERPHRLQVSESYMLNY